MRVCDAVALFLDDRKAAGCRPATISFYRFQLGRLDPCSEVPTTPAPLRALLAAVGGSPSSRHAAFRALRVFYRFLVAEGLLDQSPMARVSAPRVPRMRQRTLDRRDVVRLLAVDLSARDRALLTLLLDVGVRSGELRGLRGRDLGDGYIVVSGKTGERVVPVHRSTLRLLQALVSDREAPVFRTRDGRPLSRYRVYRIVRAALERAGLGEGGKRGPHALRHTFGRHWVAAGGGLPQLQRILGHAAITTTMVYVDLAVEEVAAEHREFSRLTKQEKLRRVV